MKFDLLAWLRKRHSKPKKATQTSHMKHYGPSSARTFSLICSGCGKFKIGQAMEIGVGVWKQLLGRINDPRTQRMIEPWAEEGSEALIAFCPVCQKVYDPVQFMFVQDSMEDTQQQMQDSKIAIPLDEFIKQMQEREKNNDGPSRETEGAEQGDCEGLCEHREPCSRHDSERKV